MRGRFFKNLFRSGGDDVVNMGRRTMTRDVQDFANGKLKSYKIPVNNKNRKALETLQAEERFGSPLRAKVLDALQGFK